LETWVFVSIVALIGLLIIVCGLNQPELGALFIFTGIATASSSSLIFVKKFKKLVENF